MSIWTVPEMRLNSTHEDAPRATNVPTAYQKEVSHWQVTSDFFFAWIENGTLGHIPQQIGDTFRPQEHFAGRTLHL